MCTMTNAELTNFIKNYLDNDKTNRAIILNGEWGTGKSYYIINSLIPELTPDRCIHISLYGINSLEDLSKKIFWDAALKQSPEILKSTPVIAGKSILTGILRAKDLLPSNSDLSDLYEKVNLKDKLVIIEDFERSFIDQTKILGYINNLVENDGVKILIVANENEISDDNYFSIKEKTIGDTIQYTCNYDETITNIISSFDNNYLSLFSNCVNEITEVISTHSDDKTLKNPINLNTTINFRIFIYACQKTVDIYNKLDSTLDAPEYIKNIFFSNIIFSNRILHDEKIEWDDTNLMSANLGSFKYPLCKFAYDYILSQKPIDSTTISAYKDEYNKYNLYKPDKATKNKDLSILYSFYTNKEADVISAIRNIEIELKNKSSNIPLSAYGMIANHLINFNAISGFNIDNCKNYIITNLIECGKSAEQQIGYIFSSTTSLEQSKSAWYDFKAKMLDAIHSHKLPSYQNIQSPEDFLAFLKLSKDQHTDHRVHGLLCGFDKTTIVRIILESSANHIDMIRNYLISIYSINCSEKLEKDAETLEEIIKHTEINSLSKCSTLDSIQKMQLGFLNSNLKELLKK